MAINRYPAQCVTDVVERLSAFVELPAGCKLMLGNGSDELIDILSVACNVPGASVLAPLPGFVMYEMSARLRGLGFVGVALSADFELDETAMLAAPSSQDGTTITITSTTAFAHVITVTGGMWDGTATTNTTATFPVVQGGAITLIAFGTDWYVLNLQGVVCAP